MHEHREDLVRRTDDLIGETREQIARLLAKSELLVHEMTEISGKMASLSAAGRLSGRLPVGCDSACAARPGKAGITRG